MIISVRCDKNIDEPNSSYRRICVLVCKNLSQSFKLDDNIKDKEDIIKYVMKKANMKRKDIREILVVESLINTSTILGLED